MANLIVESDSDDTVGTMRGGVADWPTCRDATSALSVDDTPVNNTIVIGGATGTWYTLFRAICWFDTSSIPMDSTINSVTLYAKTWSGVMGSAPMVMDPGDVSKPAIASDFNIANWSGKYTAGSTYWAEGSYGWKSVAFTDTSIITAGGTTCLSILDTYFDYDDVPLPGYRNIGFYCGNSVSNKLYLDIDYDPPVDEPVNYRLVCDYDGAVDWDGTGREVDLDIISFAVNDFDVSGSIYKRAVMAWDPSMSVGTRQYRTKNTRLNLKCRVEDEDTMRLVESWGLLFPERWVPSRGFDCLKYYDDGAAEYEGMEGAFERPNNTPKMLFANTDDYLYIGSATEQFTDIDVFFDTVAIGGTIVWDYWDGDSWEPVTVTNGDFTADAKMYWTAPGDWAKYTVAPISDVPMYYVRANATGSPSTNPEIIFIKRHRPISCYLKSTEGSGNPWVLWFMRYGNVRYYPNSFVIERIDRVLTPGAPSMYLFNISLVEANY